MYRWAGRVPELLLVHPGGPFWAKKDIGAWSIPKGEFDPEEDPLQAAKREFAEELGVPPPDGPYLDLGQIAQSGHKTVIAFAVEGDFDPEALKSNLFEMEWPPKSGQSRSFPEVDRAGWFTPGDACERILPRQAPLIDRLLARLGSAAKPSR